MAGEKFTAWDSVCALAATDRNYDVVLSQRDCQELVALVTQLREENSRLRQELAVVQELADDYQRADHPISNDTCPHCKRPIWDTHDDDLTKVCFAKGDSSCELYCQLTEARERLNAAERVIEATEAISDRSRPLLVRDRVAYERALSAYQALKRPDKEE